jgi:hypothetical protein
LVKTDAGDVIVRKPALAGKIFNLFPIADADRALFGADPCHIR